MILVFGYNAFPQLAQNFPPVDFVPQLLQKDEEGVGEVDPPVGLTLPR